MPKESKQFNLAGNNVDYFYGQTWDAYKNDLAVSIGIWRSFLWSFGIVRSIEHLEYTETLDDFHRVYVSLRGVYDSVKFYESIDNNECYFLCAPWNYDQELNKAIEFEYGNEGEDSRSYFIHKDGIDYNYVNARYLWTEGDYDSRHQFPYGHKVNWPTAFFIFTRGINLGGIRQIPKINTNKKIVTGQPKPKRRCCP